VPDLLSNIRDGHRQRPRDLAGLECACRSRAHIDDQRCGAGLDQLIQFIDVDAGHAQRAEELAPLPPLHGHVADQQHAEQRGRQCGQMLHVRQQLRHLRLQHHADAERGAHPQDRTRTAQQHEARPAHAGRARQRRGDDRQPRYELGDHQRTRAPAFEAQLCLADTRVRIERDATQQLHDAAAIATPSEVPTDIGHQAGHRGAQEQLGHDPMAAGGNRARDDQGRQRRHRQADLIEQHIQRDDRHAKLTGQRRQQVIHA